MLEGCGEGGQGGDAEKFGFEFHNGFWVLR